VYQLQMLRITSDTDDTLQLSTAIINPLECKGNYSATSNTMKLVHWPLTARELLHLVQLARD